MSDIEKIKGWFGKDYLMVKAGCHLCGVIKAQIEEGKVMINPVEVIDVESTKAITISAYAQALDYSVPYVVRLAAHGDSWVFINKTLEDTTVQDFIFGKEE